MSANPDFKDMSGYMEPVYEPAPHSHAGSDEGLHVGSIPRITVHGFCLTDATMRVAEAAMEDRRMAKAHLKLDMGGIPAAIETFEQAPTPNLIVVKRPAGGKTFCRASIIWPNFVIQGPR